MREFLRSFQLSIIQPVPEIPRHQCVGCYLCVRLNGATGPPLHNEARPFAVTPPHQGDREARSEGRNKKAGSEKEKEGERGRLKNGGGKKRENGRGAKGLTAGSASSRTWQRGRRRWSGCPFQKQDGLRRKGFRRFSQNKKPPRERREREPERERGREGKRVGP